MSAWSSYLQSMIDSVLSKTKADQQKAGELLLLPPRDTIALAIVGRDGYMENVGKLQGQSLKSWNLEQALNHECLSALLKPKSRLSVPVGEAIDETSWFGLGFPVDMSHSEGDGAMVHCSLQVRNTTTKDHMPEHRLAAHHLTAVSGSGQYSNYIIFAVGPSALKASIVSIIGIADSAINAEE
ncbi:MAG: hypothetical protein MHMPM18_004543 [Marteilia pararefringens]